MQHVFSGLPAAPGIGVGTLYIYNPLPQRSHPPTRTAQASTPAEEWERFVVALQRVDDELARLSQVGNSFLADIFHVHREILHDKTLTDSVLAGIDNGLTASAATEQATADLVHIFENLSDAYFASRATDIRDVSQRLLAHLDGVSLAQQLHDLPPDTILVAEDLTAFDTGHLSSTTVVGIALACVAVASLGDPAESATLVIGLPDLGGHGEGHEVKPDLAMLIPQRDESDRPEVLGGEVDAGTSQHPGEVSDPAGTVMVARDRKDRGDLPEADDRLLEGRHGFLGRYGAVIQVARDDDRVRPLVACDPDDFLDGRGLQPEQVVLSEAAAQVPVSGVEDLQFRGPFGTGKRCSVGLIARGARAPQ